jgi:hypothetical protein
LNKLSLNLSPFLEFIDPLSEQLLFLLSGISVKAITDDMLRMIIVIELTAINASVAVDLRATALVTKLFIALTLYNMAAFI